MAEIGRGPRALLGRPAPPRHPSARRASMWRADCAGWCASASSRSAATAPSRRSSSAAPRPARSGRTPGSTTRSSASTRHSSPAVQRTAWSVGATVCWWAACTASRSGRSFFGESMFSREREASKVALVHLVARLRLGGYRLLDTQFLTPHLASFGGVEITRGRYHRLLADALTLPGGLPLGLARRRRRPTRSPSCNRANLRHRPGARAPTTPGSTRTSNR